MGASGIVVGYEGMTYAIQFDYINWNPSGYRETFCVATQEFPQSLVISEGSSLCAPMDTYKRAFGRKNALARAIRAMPRELRTAIWRGFWTLFPKDR